MLTYTWILSKIIGVAHRKRFSQKNGIVHHQSFVFISEEPKHDAKFAYTLLRLIVPQLKEFNQSLKYIH